MFTFSIRFAHRKFDEKTDEVFLVGYSVNGPAFRVYNLVTKRVEVNLHVNFLEEKPNVQGIGHRWMFDLDYLTDSMNYVPVSLQNQANPAGSKEVIDIDVQTEEAADLMTHSPKQPSSTPISKSADDIMTFRKELDALALKHLGPVPATAPTSTNPVNTGSDNLNTGFEEVTPGNIEAISPSADHEEEVFSDADDDDIPENKEKNYDKSNEVDVSTNHTLRIHNAHPQSQILGDPNTPVQTRSSLKKITEAHALVSYIQAQQRSNHKDQQHCLQVKQNKGGIFISQDKYVAEILKKFALVNVKAAITPHGKSKCLFNVWFTVSVTPKDISSQCCQENLKYLKGKPNLGLWYPRESPLHLEAFSDSDYGGSNLDRKSTTGGCQFLG
ncbi:hypothetical protein Tco_0604686 [Tanacetum coccineum]